MPIHVIDTNNPLPPTYGDGETVLEIGDGDGVVLAEGAEIAAYGRNSWGIFGGFNSQLSIDGRVYSAWETAIAVHGNINIGATGIVEGQDYGIQLISRPTTQTPSVLTNAGTISSIGTAIWAHQASAVLINSGTIVGTYGIAADSVGAGGTLTINNTGIIKGTSGYAIFGGILGSTIVRNDGHIEGNITLGHNADFYDGRGGTVSGLIDLRDGNDIAYGGESAESIEIGLGDVFVDGGGASDTILFHGYTGLTVDLRRTDRQQTSTEAFAVIRNIENVTGGGMNDLISGSEAANVLDGMEGNDILAGYGGDDRFHGGSGNDEISGGSGTDVAEFSGDFVDYSIQARADGSFIIADNRMWWSEGRDILTGVEYLKFADRTIALTAPSNAAPTSISNTIIDNDTPVGAVVGQLSGVDPNGDVLGYSLVTNPGGHFRIHGDKLLVDRAFTQDDEDFEIVVRVSDPHGTSIDRTLTIHVTSEVISIPPGETPTEIEQISGQSAALALTLKGGRKADVLVGGDGNDQLNGGLGRDKLTGGDGADVFVFSTALKNNLDRITDFEAADTIRLSKAVFTKLHKGSLTKDTFHIGKEAQDSSDRIIFNAKTGALFYDADGSGGEHAAVKFAQLKAKAALTEADFLVL
jgi:serralysin